MGAAAFGLPCLTGHETTLLGVYHFLGRFLMA